MQFLFWVLHIKSNLYNRTTCGLKCRSGVLLYAECWVSGYKLLLYVSLGHTLAVGSSSLLTTLKCLGSGKIFVTELNAEFACVLK